MTENTALDTAAAEANKTAMEHMARYNTEAMRTLTTCSGQFAGFVSRRLSEDFAMPQRLMACKTPMELLDVWSDFYKTAMRDYARQTTEMLEMARPGAGEAASGANGSKPAQVKQVPPASGEQRSQAA